ncbi:MAG TPA: Crp/Fnr family transcriptional regulator [Niabella sp.]|nr:Crp/Fnr family transcriptional regulator [Niabella sp.]HOZ97217.1 Crp/Fnr family transcriptional regulator [Niabella sp.]HQW14205.1 Crp/Fnr family transcriptional regulator [Niabella sp.]HQX19605.1 Crp/Fnr family transcriptional regulator [Niabella sp.]HQX39961.1 Crp/Fnr family transcriptional regulator [Niabella sp.]
MQIDYNILIAYGGVARKIDKGEFVYHENTMPFYYFQVVSGEIKHFSTNSEGKELTQGIFKHGQSFGEPSLLLNKPYTSTSQALTDSVIVKIRKEHLLKIFDDYPDLVRNMMYNFAERILNKSSAFQIWVQHTPEEKITEFLKKNKQNNINGSSPLVNFTRQQIADFTGLRVETVIRTLTRMKIEGKVKIKDRKLYY